jgi:hypothetical protein
VVTWPYLWPDPIHRFLESLQLAAVFSRHCTLFRDQWYVSGNLPWDFFPTLTALRLTESAVLLAAAGIFVTIRRIIRREQRNFLIGILALWVGVPLILLNVFKTAGYEFRQFLFMLPPVLLVAGIGLEAIGARLRRRWAMSVLFVLALLPGVVGIIQLHPYEYIYFNSFAGGVNGADSEYDLERECLSYRRPLGFQPHRRTGRGRVVPRRPTRSSPLPGDLVLHDLTAGLSDADFVLSCKWRMRTTGPPTGSHESRKSAEARWSWRRCGSSRAA